MFRLWVKKWKDTHLLEDLVIRDDTPDTRTHKVFRGLEKACMEMDLAVPSWLELQIRDFQRHARCRFTQDCFIEEIPYDYLEIQVIEED